MHRSEFTEKEFYLEEFRGRTLLCAVYYEGDPGVLRALGEVTGELVRNGTRVLVVAAGGGVTDDTLRAALSGPADVSEGASPCMATLPPGAMTLPFLADVWGMLRSNMLLAACCDADSMAGLVERARILAERLRARKLIVLDPTGGIRHPETGRLISFANARVLGQLLADERVADRRALLGAIERALAGGVEAVNVCTVDGAARELFTYEGAGTLCTREEYCRVARLGVDDFHEVEKLLERGQREGFLKERSAEELAEILFEGFGATVGHRHLAGVCALRTVPYASHHAGEIVGLYTLTRFKGEGVGLTLVASMKAEARERRLSYLFACTTRARVGDFFGRQGFRRVDAAEVPAEKWHAYDPIRQRRVQVYRLDLDEARG